MNDQDARLMLRPLGEESVPPSGLDVATLVGAGRRRVRRRRLAALAGTGGLAAVALLAVPLVASGVDRTAPGRPSGPVAAAPTTASREAPAPAPAVPATCVVRRLPVPAGVTEAVVYDGDPTGRFQVGVGYAATETSVLLWDAGRLTVLSPPTAGADTLVVNASGVVAGSGDGIAWVYENSTYRRLPLVDPGPGGGVEVTGINARGEVVGNQGTLGKLKDDVGVRHPLRVPVRWPAGAGSPRALPLPAGDLDVSAADIADDGTVVGQKSGRDDQPSRAADRALVWTGDGEPRELAATGGAGATAIAGDWVIGWSAVTDGFRQERWNLRTGAAAPVDQLAYVGEVNQHGWMAGFVRASDGFETPAFAAGGTVVRLPSLDGAAPSKEGPGAYTISDDGRVLSGLLVSGPDERPFPVRWTCR